MTKAKLTTHQYNELLGIDDSYKAPDKIMEILSDKIEREKVFRSFLEAFNYDVSYDWFHDYFQDEHAERKKKKQDFTPHSVGKLLNKLLQDDSSKDGNRYEICAGTGSITIQTWQNDRMQHSPFDYEPSMYMYTCEELSDRAIPFLLFNLMIRGMNAVVILCDTLSRKSKGIFFIQNENDDHLQFSHLYRMPYNDTVAKEFAVTWSEERYDEFDKIGRFPKHLGGQEFLEVVKSNAKKSLL